MIVEHRAQYSSRTSHDFSGNGVDQRAVDTFIDPTIEFEQVAGKKVKQAREALAIAKGANASREMLVFREKALQKAAWELATPFLPNVTAIASRMDNYPIEFPDRVSIGTIGLYAAARAFDHTRGWRFLTLAGWRIRGEILDAVRVGEGQLMHISKHERNKRKRAIQESSTNGEADAEGLMLQIPTVSLDTEVAEGRTIEETLPDTDPTPEEIVLLHDQAKEVLQAIASLPERNRYIIGNTLGLYDGQEHPAREIGRQLGISESRVVQLKLKAYQKIKAAVIA